MVKVVCPKLTGEKLLWFELAACCMLNSYFSSIYVEHLKNNSTHGSETDRSQHWVSFLSFKIEF